MRKPEQDQNEKPAHRAADKHRLHEKAVEREQRDGELGDDNLEEVSGGLGHTGGGGPGPVGPGG